MATSYRSSSSLGEQFAQGEAVFNLARQRIRTFNWGELQHFNMQGVANYCSNQPIAALIVGIVAMLSVLPVMLGITLFVLSVMTFTFMTLGIVMVSTMIFMTFLCMGLILFSLGYYFNHLKKSQRPPQHYQ